MHLLMLLYIQQEQYIPLGLRKEVQIIYAYLATLVFETIVGYRIIVVRFVSMFVLAIFSESQ